MSTHYVTVVRSGDEHDDVESITVECTDPASCDGWEECREKHEGQAEGPDHGPYAGSTETPWCDEEEWPFHGEIHVWRYGWGWTLPLGPDRCPVVEHDCDFDEFSHLPSGRHEAEEEWDDDALYLSPVEPPPPGAGPRA